MLRNIFVITAIALILIVSGCKKSCNSCVHGTCSGNSCNCPDPYSGNNCDTTCAPGYEGYMCETYSKEKFLGTSWTCTSSDPQGNKTTFLIVFSNFPATNEDMYLTNFNNKGYVVTCTMTGKYKFDIQDQTSTGSLHVDINGYANLDNGKMTLYIEENGVNYFATASRQ